MPRDRFAEEIMARASPLFWVYRFSSVALLLLISLTYGTLIINNPSFQIHNFYVPALNNFTNSTSDSIFFDLSIQNSMLNVGVRYDAVNLTFSYGSMTLGTYTVAGFYQGMDKKAQRREVVMVTSSLPWKEAALGDLSGGSTAEFRVDIETNVKLKNWFWYFKHKKITAGGRVGVDDSGKKVGTKSVEVKSAEPPPSLLKVVFWAVGFVILAVACLAVAAFGSLFCMS
ncbi:hypothetical protein ACS0TY_032659 [Phlomoides rotata]